MSLNIKRIAGVVIGSALLLSSGSQVHAEAEAPAGISLQMNKVTVYEDRALVERDGEAEVQAGIASIRVVGLPVNLFEASLRAALPDDEAAKVLSITTRTEERLETQDEQLRALEKEQEGLNNSLSRLDARRTVLKSEESYLRAFQTFILRNLSERSTLGTVTTDNLKQSNEFLSDRRAALADARRNIAKEEEDLEEKLKILKKKIAKISTPHRKHIRYADIVIESPTRKTVALSVSYLIGSASWRPRYEAHLTNGSLTVHYMGEVRQGTGESWKDVVLVLSTARPSLGAMRPKLAALRLDGSSIAPAKHVVSVGLAAAAKEEEILDTVEAPPPAPPVSDVHVKDSGTSVVFQLPEKNTIPSDRRTYKLRIMSFQDDKPKLTNETTPKLMRYVYLKCVTTNRTTFPMLPGAVDIFRENGFMGTSSTVFTPPGKELSLSFGIDEDLKVQRIRLPKLMKTKKKTSRKVEYRFAFETEVANYKDTEQTVTVVDNFPISDVAEVTVQLDDETTPRTRQDRKYGRLEWDLKLKPGEKRKLHLEYTIVMPKDMQWNPYAGGGPDIMPLR